MSGGGFPAVPAPLRPLLIPPAALYRGAVALRNALYDRGCLRSRRLPCAVVSVGNLTVGGTGKTPVTAFLAAALRDAGWRVGVASRGYRRSGGGRTLLVADGTTILAGAAEAGDEPYLIARATPGVGVAVGADRAAAAGLLLSPGAAEVILLDDGFQHRRLARDLNLLLVDGRDPWGNGKMLPLGPLREPPGAARRADAVLVTRSGGETPPALRQVLERHAPGAMLFHCRLAAAHFERADGERVPPSALEGRPAYAFSGIARPERFEEDLRAAGLRVVGARRFSDHHPFRPADLEEIGRAARAAGAEILVTTEKDRVRIGDPPRDPPLHTLALRVVPAGPRRIDAWVLERLAARAPAGRAVAP